jgi:hypothetical protein
LTTRAVVTVTGFNESNRVGLFVSQSVGLIRGDEYVLAILDPVGGT